MTNQNPLKRIFDLYTSDLSFNEIERLIKRDAAGVYEFYSQNIPKPDTSKNKLIRALIFARGLFNAFLLKMPAARRVVYLIILLLFFVGYIQDAGGYLIISFVLLNVLFAFELADKLIFKDDLELARKIQNDLMPKGTPPIDGFDIATYYESAREVGGDYYEIIKSNAKSFIVLGDISGKGLPAALYMVRVQAMIQTLIKDFNSAKDILLKLKAAFSKNLTKGYFLTMVAASFDENGKYKICSAGHTPVLWYKSKLNEIEEINPKGIGIGLNDKGVFENTLEEIKVRSQSGDILLFFTDGLCEAMNKYHIQFGVERTKKLLLDHSEMNAEEIKNQIIKEIKQFRSDAPVHDDLTMVVIKTTKF